MSGIIFVNRNGLRWRDASKDYSPHKALYDHWKRWGAAGVFAQMMERLSSAGADRKTVMIDATDDLEELGTPPNFGLHERIGDRKGTRSMAVTRNWRLTFRFNDDGALTDMDLEDYNGS